MSRPYALSRAFAWAAAVLIYLIMRLVNLIVSSVCHRQGLACHWRLAHSVPRSSYRLWRQNGQGRLCHLTSNPTTVKAFPKTFPTEMKPRKFPAKEKNGTRKAKVQGKEENEKPILKPKAYFLRMPEHWNLIFCIWKRDAKCSTYQQGFGISWLLHVMARENVMALCFNNIRRCIYSN